MHFFIFKMQREGSDWGKRTDITRGVFLPSFSSMQEIFGQDTIIWNANTQVPALSTLVLRKLKIQLPANFSVFAHSRFIICLKKMQQCFFK